MEFVRSLAPPPITPLEQELEERLQRELYNVGSNMAIDGIARAMTDGVLPLSFEIIETVDDWEALLDLHVGLIDWKKIDTFPV